MFRGDNSALRTSSLFWERWMEWDQDRRTTAIPLYSLYLPDVYLLDSTEPLTCCRTTFVEIGDPTGYKWAMKYLEGWNHWERLMKSAWFREAVEVWQNELLTKVTQEAFDKIKKISKQGEGPTALAASKYLANHDWLKTPGKRGRPLKEKPSEPALPDEDAEDFKRATLRLATSNGLAVNG